MTCRWRLSDTYHAIAYSQDSVIQLSAAALLHNAAAVELQAAGGADGHTHRLLRDSLLQRSLIILWHVLKAVNGDHIPERPANNGSVGRCLTAFCSAALSFSGTSSKRSIEIFLRDRQARVVLLGG